MSESSDKRPVVIVGAGVIGLTLAHHLLYPAETSSSDSDKPPRPVLILADSLPTDPQPSIPAEYASLWAGAHHRPIPASTPQLAVERTLALHTHSVMLRLASAFPESQTGIACMPAQEYLEQEPDSTTKLLRSGDTYAGPNDDFRVLNNDELASLNTNSNTPSPAKWACTYNTYCVNPTLYLRFLLKRIQARGGRILQTHIPSLSAAYTLATNLGFLNPNTPPSSVTIADCSGRGVHADPKTSIIRGQTVLVAQQFHKTITRQCRDGSWAFLIPRPGGGGTIVGGTKEVGDYETRPRRETRRKLLSKAVELFPEFVDDVEKFDVVRDNVGFRPAREGGVRIESENVDLNGEGAGGGQGRVVYGYGLGGRGYELSWGVAERVAELIDGADRAHERSDSRTSGAGELRRARL